jgi:hypothetical protein
LILFAAGLTNAPEAVSPPRRGASFQGLFSGNDGREAFEPPAQIIRENESAAPALHGAKLAGLDRPIQLGPTGPGDLASLRDVVGKRCVHLPHHHSAGKIPANTSARTADSDGA